MPSFVDQAIVLRCWDFSETSQTVALFCRDQGLLRGLAKGAKRPKSNFSGGFEPLTRGEIVAIVKHTTDLATLTEWDLQEVFMGPRRRLDAHYAGMYMADLASRIVTDADPHPALWEALCDGLASIENPETAPMAVLATQWAALVETGHRPLLETAPVGESTVGFDPYAGAAGPDPGGAASPYGPWRVRRSTIDLLQNLGSQGVGVPLGVGSGVGDVDAGESVVSPLPVEPDTIARASRLLAAYLQSVLDRRLAATAALFPDLA